MLYSAETVGHTGDWGNLDVCPPGQYVVGFSLKSEKNKGLGDDTALNGIRYDDYYKKNTKSEETSSKS